MRFIKIFISSLLRFIPDKFYLQLISKRILWYRINFKNPRTYNEKLNRLKLYDRNPLYTKLVDKYEVKKYIEEKVGKEYVIPTLWVWSKFDDINFDELPEQFVLKCTHNSWWLIVVKDKNQLNIEEAKFKFEKWLSEDHYLLFREWPYKNVKPKIIIEKYVEDDMIDDLRDYKFMCFNWIPKYVYITVKNDNIFENWYDMDFNKVDIFHWYPQSKLDFQKPKDFEKMKDIAKKLSQNIPFVRVDLHYVKGQILFWEMTFYDWAWLWKFGTIKQDNMLWDLIKLPKKKIQ